MNNNKIGKVLIVFIIIMFGLFGYLIYSKLDIGGDSYIAESEFKTVDLDSDIVKRALNSLSFPYEHKQTDLENRLFNDSNKKAEDLTDDEKLLLILNDLSSVNELPKKCTNNYVIYKIDYFKNSVIKETKFIDKLKTNHAYEIGPFEIDYNPESIMVTNKECNDNPLEYERLIPIKATKSNKRLIIEFKYIFIEENVDYDETIYYKSYKDNNKVSLVDSNYSKENTNLDEYNTYEVTFNIHDDNIFFKEILKK